MESSFVIKIYKSVETDNFKNGCKDDFRELGLIETIKTPYFINVLAEIKDRFKTGNIENSNHYLTVTQLENEDSFEPDSFELEQFKAGKIDLYCASYTIFIERVFTDDFNSWDYETILNNIETNKAV